MIIKVKCETNRSVTHEIDVELAGIDFEPCSDIVAYDVIDKVHEKVYQDCNPTVNAEDRNSYFSEQRRNSENVDEFMDALGIKHISYILNGKECNFYDCS